MLDADTTRVVFVLVATTTLLLFASIHRTSRTAVSPWWPIALVLFLLAAVLWLFNGTDAQPVANPLGNGVAVSGAIACWLGARPAAAARPRWYVLAPLPLLTVVVALLDHPDQTVWPGGTFYLIAMTLVFALASRELWRSPRAAAPYRRPGAAPVTTTLAVVATFVALFYLGRTVTFVVVGPDHVVFHRVFGTVPHTLVMTIMVIAAVQSMGALSQATLLDDLRRSAEYDDLTGLLHRKAFLRLAKREVQRAGHAAVVVADLDHFKRINDAYGHAVGDLVLSGFADVLRRSTREGDLQARFGGEEFVVLMPGATLAEAEAATIEMNALLRSDNLLVGDESISASFGIVRTDHRLPLDDALTLADDALYQAKREGRARTVVHDTPGDPLTSPADGE